jgi:hydrogenase maturation factor
MGKPEQDIVLLKWIGLEGTFRAMREKETELQERFVHTFLSQIKQMESQIFSAKEIDIAKRHGASAMHQITEGGILAALWEMADASEVGLEVQLKEMSIRQETVEICEFCHLNPYQLTSTGSVLVFTERGEELVQKYEDAGIKASLLGRTTANAERVILGGEEKRFLDKPATDELLRLYYAEV